MKVPDNLKYTESHEWVKVDGDTATIGITEYAVEQLGDIVFVELPSIGDEVSAGDTLGVVESVKTVSDLYSPVSGEAVERNSLLLQEVDGEENPDFHPETLNQSPFGEGWMLKVKMAKAGETDKLMSAEEYQKFVEEQ